MALHRVRKARFMSGALIVGVLASLTVLGPAKAGEASATPPGGESPVAPGPGAGGSADSSARQVTLITGDRLMVRETPDSRLAVTVDPAPRKGYAPSFKHVEYDGQTYVIPSDAASLIPNVLDRELFNVTKLVEYGYTQGVPVIVTYDQARRARTMARGNQPGVRGTETLGSVDGVAATIDDNGAWWQAAGARTASGSMRTAAAGPLAGVDKVWLDGKVEVALDGSVPQIGGPAAWEAGFDGARVDVAVLDTGVDPTHPDLADQIEAMKNFTAAPDAIDRSGHGTHVASTVAGTGAASDGRYTGVAPGADIMNGKVANQHGSSRFSWIIEGMEWAAHSGAEVVNTSISTCNSFSCTPGDGTSVVGRAVDTLTSSTGTLFVIAAGNAGPAEKTIGIPGAADAALTVGAVNGADELADFSSRGPRVGDFAIKPDVTAPGANIVSARAEDTGAGTPVGEHYTRMSGTSMATPHVAGAAAILLQQHPDLDPAELKATLTTTAEPNDNLDVYQQGGGRIDIPAALHTPVRATPTPLDLGYFRYPHGDAKPASTEVTYTNTGEEPVTLDLSLAVESRDGAVAGDGMLSVSPDSLTLGPGESAPATVTVDITKGEFGLYGGYLVGRADGEVLTRSPVGFYKEPVRYDLTIKGIARDGQQARGGSRVDVLDAQDMEDFTELGAGFTDGTATFRVPPGTYAVMGMVNTYVADQPVVHERAFVSKPEVDVREDTTVVLDARTADHVTIDTPDHDNAVPRDNTTLGYWRAAEQSGEMGVLFLGPAWRDYYATQTEPVTLGDFEFFSHWRLGLPELALDVADPVNKRLDALYMNRSPAMDGEEVLPLVHAGHGAAEDYEGVDAEGAIVLVRRGGPGFDEKERNAAAAGAAALVVANNVPGQVPNYAVGRDATIPTLKISQQEGDELLALLEDGKNGDVTMRLRGNPDTPYMYELVLPEADRIPADLHYEARTDELATVVNRFHSDVEHRYGESRSVWRPWMVTSVVFVHDQVAPLERTEYLSPGDTRYQQDIRATNATTLEGPVVTYEAGEHREQSWLRQVARPGVRTGQPVYRDGNTLHLQLAPWVDDQPTHRGALDPSVDTAGFRLHRDGKLVAEADQPRGAFPMSPEPAEYRLELDVAREADWWTTSTETHTTWTLQSKRPDNTQILPLLLVDYEVNVDLSNRATKRGAQSVGFTVRHQPGAEKAAIDGARVWASYDEGQSWHRVKHLWERDDGQFRALLTPNRRPPGADHVSLRVEAWDHAGNRIEQEIVRAYALR